MAVCWRLRGNHLSSNPIHTQLIEQLLQTTFCQSSLVSATVMGITVADSYSHHCNDSISIVTTPLSLLTRKCGADASLFFNTQRVEAVIFLPGASERNNRTSPANWLRKHKVVIVSQSNDQFKMP